MKTIKKLVKVYLYIIITLMSILLIMLIGIGIYSITRMIYG